MNKELINPSSIVVVGGSNNTSKPGGSIVRNIIDGGYKGLFEVVNPNETLVQGVKSHHYIQDIQGADLAILVIPAISCFEAVRLLIEKKHTKAFIIISAGFSEETENGKEIEDKITKIINNAGATLIGPNCIGVINESYKGVFTSPVPKYVSNGCDLISSSGATAVFIMEAGIPLGLNFANVFSVGNGAQTGVEEVLQYMDETFNLEKSSKVKLLYIEEIKNPLKFYLHASSLIKKGCKIAAIKSGVSDAGGRAAASHTGALASSDTVIRALFRKAGIVYCSGRNELITVASIFNYQKLKGKNIAVITHAGGSAVMLTDALEKGGLQVPEINGKKANELLSKLYKGSSISNPIDFLATGTAEQLGTIIDYCEKEFDEIDGMAIVFGSPGLFNVKDVYKVLNSKMEKCIKPIFPILPSLINARGEIDFFLSKGRINFPDEVVFGIALSEVFNTPEPIQSLRSPYTVDKDKIKQIIEESNSGYLNPLESKKIMEAAGIPIVSEKVISTTSDLDEYLENAHYPVVAKVIGPVHKTEVNGVVVNIDSNDQLKKEFKRLIKIDEAKGVLVQTQLSGLEIYIGAKYEEGYGHLILFGLGGIFIEILNDVSAAIAPLSYNEVDYLLKKLKGIKLINGYRGMPGINKEKLIEIILRVSSLVRIAPQIKEMDLNPLIAFDSEIKAVDIRVKL